MPENLPHESGERFFKELADFAPVMIWRSGTDALCGWFNTPSRDFGRKVLTPQPMQAPERAVSE